MKIRLPKSIRVYQIPSFIEKLQENSYGFMTLKGLDIPGNDSDNSKIMETKTLFKEFLQSFQIYLKAFDSYNNFLLTLKEGFTEDYAEVSINLKQAEAKCGTQFDVINLKIGELNLPRSRRVPFDFQDEYEKLKNYIILDESLSFVKCLEANKDFLSQYKPAPFIADSLITMAQKKTYESYIKQNIKSHDLLLSLVEDSELFINQFISTRPGVIKYPEKVLYTEDEHTRIMSCLFRA
jgi:hypothetical protein